MKKGKKSRNTKKRMTMLAMAICLIVALAFPQAVHAEGAGEEALTSEALDAENARVGTYIGMVSLNGSLEENYEAGTTVESITKTIIPKKYADLLGVDIKVMKKLEDQSGFAEYGNSGVLLGGAYFLSITVYSLDVGADRAYFDEDTSVYFNDRRYTKQKTLMSYAFDFSSEYSVTFSTQTFNVAGNEHVYLDENDGKLYLWGKITANEVNAYANNEKVVTVFAQKGTVLPDSCTRLFKDFKARHFSLSNADSSGVKQMAYMFDGCSNATAFRISGLDTSNVTNMSGMFDGCSSVKMLDLLKFDTSNVSTMSYMFRGCSELTDLYIDNFNTSKVTHFISMFRDCTALESVDISSFDMSNATDLQYMFRGCSSLVVVYISEFNLKNAKNMSYMFSGCTSLDTIDVSKFNAPNVSTIESMFYYCSSLKSIDLSGFGASAVTDVSNLFYHCSSLEEVNLSGLGVSNVTDFDYMFSHCENLMELDLTSFDVKSATGMVLMFSGCKNLKTIYVSKDWEMPYLQSANQMFINCDSLVGASGTVYDVYTTDQTYARVDVPGRKGYFTGRKEAPVLEMTVSQAPIAGAKMSFDDYALINGDADDYELVPESTCWYDVDNSKVLGENDPLLFGVHYVFMTKMKTTSYEYTSVPETFFENSKAIHSSNGKDMIKIVAYHLNEDGTLDVYGELYREQLSGTFTTGPEKQDLCYYPPAGTVYRYSGYATYQLILARSVLPFNVSASSTTANHRASVIMPAYCDYMDITQTHYEMSFDGGEYKSLAVWNSVTQTGLFPGTEHVYKVRLAGAEEPFYETSVTTTIADDPLDGYVIVTFDANDVSGLTVKAYAKDDEKLVLPKCEFEGVKDAGFDGWEVDGTIYQPMDKITPVQGMVIKAIWTKGVVWSASATFAGTIEMNFYCEIPEKVLKDKASYVTMTIDGDTTVKKLVKDARKSSLNGHSLRVFSYPVVAKKLREQVMFKLYDGAGNEIPLVSGSNKQYGYDGCPMSIAGYCDLVIANSTDAKMVALAKAVKDYGVATQIYFKYKSSGLSVSSDVTSLDRQKIFNDYVPVKTGEEPAGFKGLSMSLALDSDNSIRVYYTYKENVGAGRFAYYVDDVKKSITRTTDGKCYLPVKNIAAKDLDQPHTFAISLGGKTLTLKVSGLTYAYVLALSSADKDVNLAKAMYLYNKTAEDYFTK